MPVRFDKYSSNILTEEGKAVNLLHKKVEDYQLIGNPSHPSSTYHKYKDSIDKEVEHYSKDSKCYTRKKNNEANTFLTNNYISKKPLSIRESPFKVIEKNISSSSSKDYGQKQNNNSKDNILPQNIPNVEWLLKNRKKKTVNKNVSKLSNEELVTKIQTIWRGYQLRKRLFNELKVFFQSNQFMFIIENVERKCLQRHWFDLLKTNSDYYHQFYNNINSIVYTKNATPLTKNNTNIGALNSQKEAINYKNKLETFLLRRMVNLKKSHSNNILRQYFHYFHINSIERKNSKSTNSKVKSGENVPNKALLNQPICFNNCSITKEVSNIQFSSLNSFENNKDYMSTANTISTIEQKNKGSYHHPQDIFTQFNQSGVSILRKHMKLFSIFSNYKSKNCQFYFMKWKEAPQEYTEKDIKRFSALYYIKVFTKSMYSFYSRKLSFYMKRWLEKALRIRKKNIKSRYAGILLLHNLFNSNYQKRYIPLVAKALIAKQFK